MTTRAIALPFLAFAASVVAQLGAPSCQSSFEWAFNSLGQSPCLVAAYAESVCNSGQFTIPSLDVGSHYTGPNGNATDPADAGDLCKCNTVAYSLISACAACQNATWIQWSTWAFNCTGVAPDAVYPETIPTGTRFPHWAYLPVTGTDIFNVTTAQLDALNNNAPESTATSGPTTVNPSATSTASSGQTTGGASGSHSSSGGGSNAGAIAGGVVGGVVGAALLGLAAWYFIRKRRAAQAAPSAMYVGTHSPMGETDLTVSPFPPPSDAQMRYYNPSDPTTYPTAGPGTPTIQTTEHQGYSGMTNNQYRGLPEV
ncbi:hypothetical protein OF83DRAFT_893521 [Amylostereum chailletii]|nr:hypothetical protein OF83DRAFT_893521 [Amylostereum chailletii]